MAAEPVDAPARPELPPFYYRDNFLALCDTVQTRYGDILQPSEQQLLRSFGAMGHAAQCLYVRLILRVGPRFRLGKLHYPEIGDLEEPLNTLIERKLAIAVSALTLTELAALYTRSELMSAFRDHLDVPVQCRKSQLLEGIESLNLSAEALFSYLEPVSDGPVILIQGGTQLELLQLLFFGNRHQSLTDFVLADLGVANYYPYSLDSAQRLFCSRAALDEYMDCSTFSDAFYELRDAADAQEIAVLASQMLARKIDFASSKWRWQRLCITVARHLERQQAVDLALKLYGLSEIHPARERSARILESQQNWPAVVSCCEEIIAAPRCEAELEAGQRIHRRALRHFPGQSRPQVRDKFAELQLTVPDTSVSVELAAAESLCPQWSAVHFVENSLMNTLFGLAFWQQIFQDVPGAFHNPFQSVPSDMYRGSFTRPRADALAERLEVLSRVDLAAELRRCREQFSDYQCRWVNWSRVSVELQETALEIIPAQHLLAIWQRQLFDPGENRSGFPDLIAFGSRAGDYCMVEVKGPGDRLQDNQKRWLRYFAAHDIPASVAWVRWADA